MSPAKVQLLLTQHFPSAKLFTKLVDGEYICVQKAWLLKTFTAYFKRYQSAYGLNFWEEEDFDCDDFALGFWQELKRAHRLTKNRPKGAAIAAGVYSYVKSSGERHMANWIVVWDGMEKVELLTLEPQSGWQTHLSTGERASCDFVLG